MSAQRGRIGATWWRIQPFRVHTSRGLGCNLAAGGVSDNQSIDLASAVDVPSDDREVVTNMLTATLATAGTATLACTPPGSDGTIDVEDLWVTAIKVNTLSHTTQP